MGRSIHPEICPGASTGARETAPCILSWKDSRHLQIPEQLGLELEPGPERRRAEHEVIMERAKIRLSQNIFDCSIRHLDICRIHRS